MNTEYFPHNLTPFEYAALVDSAKLRATELRREAIRAFWSAVGRAVLTAWRAIGRRTAQPRRHFRSEAHACPR
jgi:hypothetical protein